MLNLHTPATYYILLTANSADYQETYSCSLALISGEKMTISVFFLSHLVVVQSCSGLPMPTFNIDCKITNDDEGSIVHQAAEGIYVYYLFWHYKRCIVTNGNYKVFSWMLAHSNFYSENR